MVSRLYRRKDWKAEYEKKMKGNNERVISNQEAFDLSMQKDLLIDTTLASKFLLDLLGDSQDAAGRAMQKTMCRHNLENLEPPPEALPWKNSWGSKILCEMCNLPAVTDCTVCRKCNAICHNQCIVDVGDTVNGYECPQCLETMEIENNFYETVLIKLESDRKMERCTKKIAHRLLILLERKRLAKKRRCAVIIQSTIRRFLARKKYLWWLRAQMKLVTVKLLHIPHSLIENGVVVLTVWDTLKNSQSFRLDVTAEAAMKQGFLIPGVAANLSILFTIARKEETAEGRRQYVMLGQAQLSLRDVTDFTKKGVYQSSFMEKIKWPPVESKGEFKYHLVSYSSAVHSSSSAVAAAMHLSSAASVCSTTSLPMISPNSNKHATSSGISASSIFSTTSTNNSNTVNGGLFYTSSSSSVATTAINPLAHALFTADRLCTVQFFPQNPVITMVAMCNGPPLDILKRAPDIGMKKMKAAASTGNYRNSRYWLCLYRLKLVFFQYYGDILPRLVSDVSEATAVQIQDSKGRKTPLVNVIHADSRIWLLEFDSKKEASKFEFALTESRKVVENASIYALKSEILASDTQFDFKVATIY